MYISSKVNDLEKPVWTKYTCYIEGIVCTAKSMTRPVMLQNLDTNDFFATTGITAFDACIDSMRVRDGVIDGGTDTSCAL